MVTDYNVNKNIQLDDFFRNSSKHLQDIGKQFIELEHTKKIDSSFLKIKNDLSVENTNTILSHAGGNSFVPIYGNPSTVETTKTSIATTKSPSKPKTSSLAAPKKPPKTPPLATVAGYIAVAENVNGVVKGFDLNSNNRVREYICRFGVYKRESKTDWRCYSRTGRKSKIQIIQKKWEKWKI